MQLLENLKKSSIKFWTLTILGAIIFISFAVNCILSSMFPDMCGNQIISEVTSPDGQLKAVVFVRDCGATTSYSAQLSILRNAEKLSNEAGNTFIEDSGHDNNVSLEVKPEWQSNRELLVRCDSKARNFKHETEYRLPLDFSKSGVVKVQYAGLTYK